MVCIVGYFFAADHHGPALDEAVCDWIVFQSVSYP